MQLTRSAPRCRPPPPGPPAWNQPKRSTSALMRAHSFSSLRARAGGYKPNPIPTLTQGRRRAQPRLS